MNHHESTLPFPGNLIHIPAAAPGAALRVVCEPSVTSGINGIREFGPRI